MKCCDVLRDSLRFCFFSIQRGGVPVNFVQLKRICTRTDLPLFPSLSVRQVCCYIYTIRTLFFAMAYTSYLQRLSSVLDGLTASIMRVCVHFTVFVCVCVRLYIVNCALYTAGCVLQMLALAGFCDWRFFGCFLSVLM